MHQITFFTTPDVKKYFLKDFILMVRKCIKTRPDVEKYLFYELDSGGLEVCANASNHVFNHSGR